MRDFSLEQSNNERMGRSPTKAYDVANMSILGQSRMQRARSTATITPYEESVGSQSQVVSKQDQNKLVDRLHSDAKFKKEMRAIYDQVRTEKELKECTFAPNKGSKRKHGRPTLRREPSERAFGKSKQLAVSLVRKEGTETEIGAVKELHNDADSNKKPKARKTKGRNGHIKQQNSMTDNLGNQMILEDAMESPNDDDGGDIVDRQNTLSKESAYSKNKKVHNDELFEYLAYNGVKNQKALELQKLKNRKDM